MKTSPLAEEGAARPSGTESIYEIFRITSMASPFLKTTPNAAPIARTQHPPDWRGDALAAELQRYGIAAFDKSWNALMLGIGSTRGRS